MMLSADDTSQSQQIRLVSVAARDVAIGECVAVRAHIQILQGDR